MPQASDQFALKKNGSYQSWCRACTNAYSAARYASRPEVRALQKERAKEWSKANADKVAGSARRRRARLKDEDPEAYRKKCREAERRYLYGVSGPAYDALVEQQNGLCAICGRPPRGSRGFAVDHCHDTDRVRGLLCTSCNVGIGNLGDDPQMLLRAYDYLTGDQAPRTAKG